MSNPNESGNFGSPNLPGSSFGSPNLPGSSSNSPQNIRGNRPIPQPNFNDFNHPQFFSNFLQQQQQQSPFQQTYHYHSQPNPNLQQFHHSQPNPNLQQFHHFQNPYHFQNPNLQPNPPQTFSQINREEEEEIRGETPRPRVRESHKKKGKQAEKPTSIKKLWTPPEEKWLASCWLDASEDGIHGNSQRATTFWGQVREKFNANNSGWLRGDDQLSGKWRHMDKACKDFSAFYNEEDRNPRRSGRNEEDVYNKAVERWQEENKKQWVYKDVWELLRKKPKWYTPPAIQGSGVRRRRASEVVLEDDSQEATGTENFTINLSEDRQNNLEELFRDDALQRPMGRERSKKAARTSTSSDASGSSRGTSSSRIDELAMKWDLMKQEEKEKRGSAIEKILEEERFRSACRAVELFQLNVNNIQDPKERKTAVKFKKRMVDRYKDLINISSDDEDDEE